MNASNSHERSPIEIGSFFAGAGGLILGVWGVLTWTPGLALFGFALALVGVLYFAAR